MLTRPDPTRQNPAKSWPDPTRPDPTRPDPRVHPTRGQLCVSCNDGCSEEALFVSFIVYLMWDLLHIAGVLSDLLGLYSSAVICILPIGRWRANWFIVLDPRLLHSSRSNNGWPDQISVIDGWSPRCQQIRICHVIRNQSTIQTM